MTDREVELYSSIDELPNRYGVITLANRMDAAERPLRREWEVRQDAIELGERLPADATRFVAVIRWLTRLEERTGIDPVPVLELLAEFGEDSAVETETETGTGTATGDAPQSESDPYIDADPNSGLGSVSNSDSSPVFETIDVVRALKRERALMRSNANDDRPGGRPSKVDRLAEEVENTVRLSANNRFEHETDTEVRDRLVREHLESAEISRATYYKLRRRVLDEEGIDLSDLDRVPSGLDF
jgi:hypothetical protein